MYRQLFFALLMVFACSFSACNAPDLDSPTVGSTANRPPTPLPTVPPTATPAGYGWACTPPASPAWGGSGLGDAYSPLWGNGGYDVQHYEIDLEVDVTENQVEGLTALDAEATQELDAFNLDFLGMEISNVSVNGADATFCRDDAGELTIIPDRPLAEGESFTTSVSYHGTPLTFAPNVYAWGWYKDADTIATSGSSSDPAFLYPNNEHWSDPAQYTIRIIVPEGYQASTVGVLVDTTQKDGLVTTTWELTSPSNATLLSISGDSLTKTFEGPAGLAVDFEYPAELEYWFVKTIQDIPELVDYFVSIFGPFPYETLGITVTKNLVVPISVPTRIFIGSAENEIRLAHELAHQWIGNSLHVTWGDSWLSEGLATYAETLWREHQGQSADDLTRQLYEELPVSTYPPGYATPEQWEPGGDVIYVRPGVAFHALRLKVGDETFFSILKTFDDRYQDIIVTTNDFISVAEEVSGQDLTAFFDAWLYQETVPDIPELNLSKVVEQ